MKKGLHIIVLFLGIFHLPCYAQFDSLNVTVSPESCGMGTAVITLKNSAINCFFNWNDGGSGHERSGLKAGIYLVTIVDASSGADTNIRIEITKTWCEVNVPITFSPNGDGINDELGISNTSLYPNFLFQVFNRWGQIVHEQKKEFKSWDGTSHGLKLPDDAYYYIFFYDADKKDEYKNGSITMLR